MTITIPIRTVSELNRHEHWRARHQRSKQQRALTLAHLTRHKRPAGEAYTIRLTRLAPRSLDPGNLEASFKWVQDAIADWLGIDDGDSRLRFAYGQEQGVPKQYGVRVSIETTNPNTCHACGQELCQ